MNRIGSLGTGAEHSGSSSPGSCLSPSPRKPRSSWFLFVTKLEETYDVHIGYKNSKGGVSEFSCSNSNVSVKIPFGTPVKCEFSTVKEGEESFGEFQVTSRRREFKKFKLGLTHLKL